MTIIAMLQSVKFPPFLFPEIHSSVLPDPSKFFAPHLLSSPLPTNSFFQNFVLKNGDQPEYIHPYLVKSSSSSISFCYPSLFSSSPFIYQNFSPDITVSTNRNLNTNLTHVISSFNDLSVTLDLPPDLRCFLVRGSPFVTCSTIHKSNVKISTIHSILSISSNAQNTKHKIKISNNQTWICYASSSLRLEQNDSVLMSDLFSGIIRFTVLPNSNPFFEEILDQYSTCYPTHGDAVFHNPFCLDYKWHKKGWGDLLLLAHPLHLRLLSKEDSDVTVIEGLKYTSIDGDLVGIVGDSWTLKTDAIPVTFHSIQGLPENSMDEIISALKNDVDGLNLNGISSSSSYFYGKAIARAARLGLIAEEVNFPGVIPSIREFLWKWITPWLDGTFNGNGFLYDKKWGGIVTKQGSFDSGADFGFGVYNDHHYHLGYFLYAIAVLSKLDPLWGRRYRPKAYSIVADIVNLDRGSNSKYPRLRCFDLWKLHSWAGGLTEFADGRNQESSSEAVNAYYSVALMGLSYGDISLITIASTLLSFEIQATQMWWHVKQDERLYPVDFGNENMVVGVLWSNKRDSGLWFAGADMKECRLGIQVLPLLPITEILFNDIGFARNLVEWASPSVQRPGAGEGWKGFSYALEGIYDQDSAIQKIRRLIGFDDGNSLSNLLWWIYSRNNTKGVKI